MKRIAKTSKKESKHITISKVIVLIVLIAIVVILLLVSTSVKKIEIKINNQEQSQIDENGEQAIEGRISEDEIKSLSGISINDKMFQKSKKTIQESIKKNPYVENVSIKRKLNRYYLYRSYTKRSSIYNKLCWCIYLY